jgi:hypothetical protein
VENTPVLGTALRFDPVLALDFDVAKAGYGERVSPWQLGSDIVGSIALPAGGIAAGLCKITGFGFGNWSAAAQLYNHRRVIDWGWTVVSGAVTHGHI